MLDSKYIRQNWFLLITIAVAALGFVIYFISLCAAQSQFPKTPLGNAWYLLVFYACVIVGVILASASSDGGRSYRLALIGFLAATVVFVTSQINSYTYGYTGGIAGMAAGLYFIAIPVYLWLFYFGSEPESQLRQFLDGRGTKLHFSGIRNASVPAGLETGLSTSAGLGQGLGTGTAVLNTPALATPMVSQLNISSPTQVKAASAIAVDPMAELQPTGKVRCLYSYEASPDDPNEISFTKGQILDILNDKGKWWQVRKTLDDGTTVVGIIPSNYVEKIE